MPNTEKKEIMVWNKNMGNFARLGEVPIKNLNQDYYINRSSIHYTKYKKEDVVKWFANPEANEKNLRNASIYLYEVSPHYRRLINYFAKLHTMAYIIEPYKLDQSKKIDAVKLKETYIKICNYIDKMNLKHEAVKILTTCFREDVFYGYVYETTDSYYIRKMPPDYCRINRIEDGCFLYQFDFSYFTSHKEDLESFGEEFVEKYELYKTHRSMRWQSLNSKRTFCLKVNEDIDFPMPPFIGVFAGIFDIDDYKGLQKARTEIGNYKILSLKIPMEDGNYKMEQEDALMYYNNLLKVLPENIGAFLTPMDVEDHDFQKSGSVDTDNVSDATKTFWNDAGVCSLIFGGDKQTSATLSVSIKSDEQMVFALMNQFGRNINRLLKQIDGRYKFKIQFLDVTYYNQQETYKSYLNAAQASLPTTTMACAALGVAPIDMINMNFLEDDILHIKENFEPLKTSYTQSSGDAGAPTQEEKGEQLSDAGENTRDHNSNQEY